jgi:enoyl-CoA hydratase/carnithine racemase
MGTLVNYATEKGVALLTLNDAPENALTHEMFKELDGCILEARFDDDVHVLVVTGHGDKHFSTGANLNMLREADETFKYYFYLHANETLLRLESTPKLVIAAVNGQCVGGGLELALACDIRIARMGPFGVGLPAVSLGVVPGMGGTQRLSTLIGKGMTMELLVEGRTLSVEEACATGMVHKAWETDTHDEFMRQVLDYAHQFCPPNYAAMAVGLTKRAAQASGESSLEQGLALERELLQRLSTSHDAKEGILALAQKRKATFRAR